jgi:hypothetical protein
LWSCSPQQLPCRGRPRGLCRMLLLPPLSLSRHGLWQASHPCAFWSLVGKKQGMEARGKLAGAYWQRSASIRRHQIPSKTIPRGFGCTPGGPLCAQLLREPFRAWSSGPGPSCSSSSLRALKTDNHSLRIYRAVTASTYARSASGVRLRDNRILHARFLAEEYSASMLRILLLEQLHDRGAMTVGGSAFSDTRRCGTASHTAHSPVFEAALFKHSVSRVRFCTPGPPGESKGFPRCFLGASSASLRSCCLFLFP